MRFLLVRITFILIILMSLCAHAKVLEIQEGVDLFKNKQYQKAQSHFSSLWEKYPDNPEIAFNLGKSAFAAGDYEKAVTVLEKAVKTDKANGDFFYVLGLSYARYIGDVGMFKKLGIAKKMKKTMETAVELDQQNADARISLVSFCLTAPALAGGSVEEAKKHIDILKSQNPEKTFWVQASYLEKHDQFDKAEAIYRKLAERNEKPLNIFNLAAYLLRREKFEESIALFKKFVKMDLDWDDPRKAGGYFFLGIAYEKNKMPQKAEKAFKKAREHNPDQWMEKEITKRVNRTH